jgi:hypothetical protein
MGPTSCAGRGCPSRHVWRVPRWPRSPLWRLALASWSHSGCGWAPGCGRCWQAWSAARACGALAPGASLVLGAFLSGHTGRLHIARRSPPPGLHVAVALLFRPAHCRSLAPRAGARAAGPARCSASRRALSGCAAARALLRRTCSAGRMRRRYGGPWVVVVPEGLLPRHSRLAALNRARLQPACALAVSAHAALQRTLAAESYPSPRCSSQPQC